MYEVKFISPDKNIVFFKIDNWFNLYNEIKPILIKHYFSLLLKTHSFGDLIILYNNRTLISTKELEEIIWEKDKPIYELINLKKITCHGCLYEIANQWGHMDIGGCLYEPEL